jgi:hypothetical protein
VDTTKMVQANDGLSDRVANTSSWYRSLTQCKLTDVPYYRRSSSVFNMLMSGHGTTYYSCHDKRKFSFILTNDSAMI